MWKFLRNLSYQKRFEELMPAYGTVLYNDIDLALELIEDVACDTKQGKSFYKKASVIAIALNEALMESENGRKLGAEFIEKVENKICDLADESQINGTSRLVLAKCWTSIGLKPPPVLADTNTNNPSVLTKIAADSPEELSKVVQSIESAIDLKEENGVQNLLEEYNSILSTLVEAAQYALVREAVSCKKEIYADLGCSLLLLDNMTVTNAVIDGFNDRLNSDNLGSATVGKLTIIRSWLLDSSAVSRIDQLIREALKRGLKSTNEPQKIKYQRIIASWVDGAGFQTILSAVDNGNLRFVSVLMLKQGFGVKDVLVLPCHSLVEQQTIFAEYLGKLSGSFGHIDVSIEYVKQSINIAIRDGLENKISPQMGLVDFAQVMGLSDLRPVADSTNDILSLIDPDGRIAELPDAELLDLILESEFWEQEYGIFMTWCEKGDDVDFALRTGDWEDTLWTILDKRRKHWAMCIARMALLLREVDEKDVDSFVAVAKAIASGWSLEKIPLMHHILTLSFAESDFEVAISNDVRMNKKSDTENEYSQLSTSHTLTLKCEESIRKLNQLLKTPNVSRDWLTGYLMAVSTTPLEIARFDWCNVIIGKLKFENKRMVETESLYKLFRHIYASVQSDLSRKDENSLLPSEKSNLSEWASGFCAVWRDFPLHCPDILLSGDGKRMLALLKDAEGGKVDGEEITNLATQWLRKQYEVRQSHWGPLI